MLDRSDEILRRLDILDEKVDCIDRKLAEMRGEQRVRCVDHERRIIQMENGASRGIRFWGALIAIIAGISGAVAAAIASFMAGH